MHDEITKLASGVQARTPEELVTQIMKQFHPLARKGRRRPQDLTPREADVLKLILLGHKSKDIAAKLFVDTKTVRWHITRLNVKLQTKTRFEMAAKLFRESRLA